MRVKTSGLRKEISCLEEKKPLSRFENFKLKCKQAMKAVYLF